ncbi:MAG: 23S rRNA (adenine(2503)-C(2))-methyltransferase RlmN [Pirellulaceae bacterium]|nr:23S rRNA (adenine(2503)-C(2))-methyltransferase RlmN [Pirellulaceae bacterium]
MMALDLHDYTRPRLAALLTEWGESPAHANRLWGALYRDLATELPPHSNLPRRLHARLAAEATMTNLVPLRESVSSDRLARKFLLGLADGQAIETVLMHYRGRWTACLSSQAGCPLGCVFCATGQAGFARNLTVGEIVGQALFAQRVLRDLGTGERLRNVVLMGMGEPLLNYDSVLRAVEILRDPAGFSIGAKQITLSTVGVVSGIRRLAAEWQPISLAVSLHGATQAERLALVPAAATWPLDQLMAACRDYTSQLGRRIFFEWTLIAGVSDSPAQARAVAELLAGIPAHVNLIPLNPTTGYAGDASRDTAAAEFQAILRERGLPSTLRARRGIDVSAGCGQLAVV